MDESAAPTSARAVAELTIVIPCYNERGNVAPMVARLDAGLAGIAWEAVFVDDDSPDGTAEAVRAIAARDPRIRCIRRIGRRGLSSAVIEGALSASSRFIAVIDGDLQHDETKLPAMLGVLRADAADLVIGSRHVAGGDAAGLSTAWRRRISDFATRVAQVVLPVPLTDPMSGFFMLPRAAFERLAPALNAQGFKILLDLVLSAGRELRVCEIPVRFGKRVSGESKLDVLVVLQFGGLLVDKFTGSVLPQRFLSFALVGTIGIAIDLAVLVAARRLGFGFAEGQTVAALVAMAANFQLNNLITYRDQRLRGAGKLRGLLIFMLVCSVGLVANVGIARTLYLSHSGWTPAAAMGAAIGVVWNYAVSATLVWRAR